MKIAEASRLYKFYLNQEKKILGTISVAVFLLLWELVKNTFQLINPMFMSAYVGVDSGRGPRGHGRDRQISQGLVDERTKETA